MWETRANQFLDDVTPDGFKISLDVGKFLLCLHFWGENFRTGPFLSRLTSRWRSSHSIPGFSPHTHARRWYKWCHILLPRRLSPKEQSFTPSPSSPYFPSLPLPFPLSLSPFPPPLFLSHQCYWVPLHARSWNRKGNDGGILLPVSSNSRVPCVLRWALDSFKNSMMKWQVTLDYRVGSVWRSSVSTFLDGSGVLRSQWGGVVVEQGNGSILAS